MPDPMNEDYTGPNTPDSASKRVVRVDHFTDILNAAEVASCAHRYGTLSTFKTEERSLRVVR